MLEAIQSYFIRLASYPKWILVIELLLIAVPMYWIVTFVRGTRGARLFKGAAVLFIITYLVLKVLAEPYGLDRIAFLYDGLLYAVLLAMVVAFQPELRRAFMQLGETRLFRQNVAEVNQMVDELVAAASQLSEQKIGAVVAIERDVGLGGVIDTGTRIDAKVSASLLNSIFWPGGALHDMGAIIHGNRLVAAGCQFPLVESGVLDGALGSRHRAAVGLSEESDAVLVVVSEETGAISVATGGRLFRDISPAAVRGMLIELLTQDGPVSSIDEPKDSAGDAE